MSARSSGRLPYNLQVHRGGAYQFPVCFWSQVDEVNFLVIPSLLFVRAFFPWFWPTSLLSLLPVLPAPLHPVMTGLVSVMGALFQLPPGGVTVGVLVVFASCVLSVVESSRYERTMSASPSLSDTCVPQTVFRVVIYGGTGTVLGMEDRTVVRACVFAQSWGCPGDRMHVRQG